MNVLLVDDESLARRRLRRLLSDATDVSVVAECGSGSAAIEATATNCAADGVHEPTGVATDQSTRDVDSAGSK